MNTKRTYKTHKYMFFNILRLRFRKREGGGLKRAQILYGANIVFQKNKNRKKIKKIKFRISFVSLALFSSWWISCPSCVLESIRSDLNAVFGDVLYFFDKKFGV